MSHFPNQHGATTTPQIDGFGNPIQHGIAKTGHITGGHGTGAGTGHITGGATTTPQIDGYGNPIQHGTAKTDHITGGHGNGAGTGHITGGHGTGAGTGAGIFGTGHAGHQEPHTLRRSGSSSSEDDGKGGRRKKGLTQKIKEKLPCGHHEQGGHAQTHGNPTTATNTAPGGVYHQTGHQEKKGMMDKIKEKLPGHGNTAP